jgi:hypothetical protein
MAEIIPDEGLEWASEKLFDQHSGEFPYVVAVGDGTNSPLPGDSSLQNELYRSTDDDSNCTVETTTSVGGSVARITVSGGGEVPAGAQITELALFVSDGSTLLYREVNDAVEVGSGERQTFEFEVNLVDV